MNSTVSNDINLRIKCDAIGIPAESYRVENVIKNQSELLDSQIVKLIGTTKKTVDSIRKKNYWNFNNLSSKDPVSIKLCTQIDLFNAVEKAKRKIERERKKNEKEKK